MLIAQISDVHFGFEPNNPDEDNRRRFDRVVARLIEGPNRVDALIVSGDITDRGDMESYGRFVEATAHCPFPVYPLLGNHDIRVNFIAAFPGTPTPDGFVQYCVEIGGLRLIAIDTLDEGRHGGAFCETRAHWLRERLAEKADIPTVIVMHHPPFKAGIAWMNTHSDEQWVGRFAAAVEGHEQIIAIWCGHVHRPAVSLWNGIVTTICPSSSAELTLDLNSLDPERPDRRSLVVDGPPGYSLHHWCGSSLVTMFDRAEDLAVLAAFDSRMQPLMRMLNAEHPF
jgi:3',5'-cyclic AMP phosphodiesterase CpdA